jgi:hypothetical protein
MSQIIQNYYYYNKRNSKCDDGFVLSETIGFFFPLLFFFLFFSVLTFYMICQIFKICARIYVSPDRKKNATLAKISGRRIYYLQEQLEVYYFSTF